MEKQYHNASHPSLPNFDDDVNDLTRTRFIGYISMSKRSITITFKGEYHADRS
jgi:hypothetical protein